ncbi:tRNA (adenosine(37)-N6)-threonylcarbamoyltransferase complex ATPase subunit type 1 TsaE [Sphingobacterium hungaricum]|uniref:tRNA threonylcarbamoyladenosine biosynthesis protein TsaE n=1 Tax=Sphingobacterium hungaricum TaxID=2082723 RepID=A0A928UZR0_9SPHI|nr:tRNA (adenosine(37)-N6)-threonylcarbamoyltransferase complex ATPase subunit type 1 TsaE [Sphingobacterium hungaricum]MBE8713807.1 tRNA (adenosine(37)-N6)-threonylcarbamoyltransferase complex ATPase subunit type 1 TsaE [Sphingobacterium hungaricum]
MDVTIKNIHELPEVAQQLIQEFPSSKVFLFNGNMGAGKTTFIKALCEVLEVDSTTSSPTFSIVNEYHSPTGAIYHFDFYRIKNEQEAFDMGYEEYFYSGNYCFIEWPEKIENLIPENAVLVDITAIDVHQRKFTAKIL